VQVNLRVWEGSNCPELDSLGMTSDRTPVEKHKKKQKHIQEITGDFNPDGSLQSTHRKGESAAGARNTACSRYQTSNYPDSVGLFHLGFGGAGETYQLLTLLGGLRRQDIEGNRSVLSSTAAFR
jgi:hypothetical protein